MVQQTDLAIAPRTAMGRAVKHLRQQGIIPANIYGHGQPSVAVQVDALAFDRLRRAKNTRNFLTLRMPDGPNQTALVRHVQSDAISGQTLHIDFFRVDLQERLAVKIPLKVTGESYAVKNLDGVLLHLLDALEVECKAEEMVEYIDVDISSLNEMDDIIHAKDIKLPANYTLATDPEEPVIKVSPPRAAALPEEEVQVAAPEAGTPEQTPIAGE
ncbi:50S ribosomal protein L25 [Ktedonosporobacter rubrisoli]|uniref:Large ribosomal subunit protein bL25 n=1 Tax=Ktedonosporobacter rubrisoli TaxID=2509675 RepID=A0A4P6JYY2_KTERU|nr:50S ribosomal protein L25 [Ktedonosporobacter rubrisoli]QBD81058.1 50S ribosomal protein L25 [Ktedonosporobacter rubrisoli]